MTKPYLSATCRLMTATFILGLLGVWHPAIADDQEGTAMEAKAMLQRAVAAIDANPSAALKSFTAGTAGFKDRDLYVFCAGPDGMMNASPEEQDEEDFRAEKMTMFVDRDLLVMRRMVVDGQMTHEGETHPVTSTVDLDDYRDINGMLYPFRTSVTMEGMAEAMGMTDDDMAEMREQLEEAKRQMDQMPEAQRAMMEKMLKQQMEQMEKMMQDQGGGGMQVEVLVKDLRVNSGPPSN